MSVFTRSITFNDQTATISFPIKLDSSNQLNWTVSLSSGTNKASTTGNVSIEPYTKPASTSLVTSWPSSITTAVAVDDNKAKHVEFIKESLNTIDTATGRDAKAACAKMLYDYLLIWGMDFIKAHERFKQTVIAKAYELKSQGPEKASMIASMDKVLTALGQPLEKPAVPVATGLTRQVACGGSLTYCGCVGCPDLTYKPVEVTTPVAKVMPVTEPSKVANLVATPAKDDATAEYNLFVAVAKRMGCTYINKNPKEYFDYYQSTVKRGYIKGSPAQMIEKYLTQWGGGGDDNHQRINLMKKLFTDNKLAFTPDVMTLYDEWQKTYKPTSGTNRYKKMCAFIDAHKTLFTTA